MLFRFPIFGGFAGRGVLHKIKAIVDAHSTVLDNVEGEDGISIRKNCRGGLSVGLDGSQSAGPGDYDSFFKVHAVGGDTVRVEVVDGDPSGSLPAGQCGLALVNSSENEVNSYEREFSDLNPLSIHVFFASLLCWVDRVLGPGCEIAIWDADDPAPTAPTRLDPAPAHIVSIGRLALGRVTATCEDGLWTVGVVQDYKQGGTAQILLLGPCGSNIELYMPPQD